MAEIGVKYGMTFSTPLPKMPLTASVTHCVICGTALPPAPPRRLTCSARCLRRKDHHDRMIRRRLLAIAEWERQRGYWPEDFLRAQIKALKEEIRDLRRSPTPWPPCWSASGRSSGRKRCTRRTCGRVRRRSRTSSARVFWCGSGRPGRRNYGACYDQAEGRPAPRPSVLGPRRQKRSRERLIPLRGKRFLSPHASRRSGTSSPRSSSSSATPPMRRCCARSSWPSAAASSTSTICSPACRWIGISATRWRGSRRTGSAAG